MVKFKFQQTELIPQDKDVLDCLNGPHEKFVVVPVDKTSNNTAIISKKSFVQLGIYGHHARPYHLSSKQASNVISKNLQFCECPGLETWE